MTADIIDNGYLFKGKTSKVWRLLVLIVLISLYITCLFFKDNSVINISIDIFTTVIFLVIIIDSFLFTRVGSLEFVDNELKIKNRGAEKIIDLSTIDEVFFAKEDRKFYYLQIDNEKMIIDIKDVYLTDFKNKLLELNIEIKHRNFLDKISEFFSIQ